MIDQLLRASTKASLRGAPVGARGNPMKVLQLLNVFKPYRR